MKYIPDFSTRFRILKGGKVSLVVSVLVAGSTMSFAAPTGGTVTTGSASIAQSGSVTTINQSTHNASINWNSFSIAPSETVNFIQPSSSSITLNRVIGTTPSLIQGAMNANGQVFLLNPNGVLFANGSQINVGGLVASTLNITDQNFQAGNYVFEGNSQNSIINMGTITASNGGYVSMIGKHVANEGTIIATMGNVQMASGEKITLNLNGNSLVKLTIDQGTFNALVENKGLIKADGGQVHLTTQALNSILDGMVNNTGIIEAQSIDDLKGEVILFAHGGTANIGGTIDASGGFVETSGKEFNFISGSDIQAAQWLIDPVNIIIDAGLASAIGTALNTGDVTITTDGSNTPDTLSGQSAGSGDINVNSAITKNSGTKTKLTLAAERDISINAAISGSSGSPLDIVLASRYHGGTLGGVYVGANLKSYGGDITIGGGNINAGDFAIAHSSTPYGDNIAGVFIGQAIIDSTGDGSGSANNTLPTATTGGNITIRGKGDTNNAHQFNNGVYFYINKTIGVVTGGNGAIYIEGHGGKANAHFWDVGAVGVNWESSNTYIKANSGDVTIKGYAGTVADRYGISSGNTFIGTGGYLDIEGDSYMLRGGTLSLNVGGSGDIKAPLLGSGTYTLAKTGAGVLNISSDAETWHNNKPSGTTDTLSVGTFTDTTNSVNLVNLTRSQALYAYSTVPTTNTVTQSAATPLGSPTPTPVTQTQTTNTAVQNQINNVVTTIVNSTTVTPIVMAPVVPQQQMQTQAQNNALLQTIIPQGSTNGGSFGLVGSTDGISAVQTVSMEQLQKASDGQGVNEIRVPLANNSMVELVNGGVNLPSGVSQEFYVVDNTANSKIKN